MINSYRCKMYSMPDGKRDCEKGLGREMEKGGETERRRGDGGGGRGRKGVGLHFASGGRGSLQLDVTECP